MKLRKKNEHCAKSLLSEIRTENRLVAARGRGLGTGVGVEVAQMGQRGQKVQTPNSKFWGYKVQHSDYSQQYCFIYLTVAKNKS